MDITPAGATWAALSAPFLARWFLASARWARVHGLTYTPNVAPRVEMSDFPSPNRAAREFVVYVVSTVVAIPVGLAAEAILGRIVPWFVWPIVFLAAIGPAVVWSFIGLRSDDRLWIQLKRERIAEAARPSSSDIAAR
jgi:hypothetical protein